MGFLQRSSGLGCFLVAMLFFAVSTPVAGKMVNRVIAVVDGFPITLYQYEQYIVHNTGGQKLGSLTEQQKLDILDGLITDTLISMQAQQLGLRVTPEDVQTYMDQIMLAGSMLIRKLPGNSEERALQGFNIGAQSLLNLIVLRKKVGK